MTPCERLSERMPVVAAGADWTPDEAAHLASCPDCAAEWRVVKAAAGVGGQLPAVDPARISARVRARLAAEPANESTVIPIRSARRGRWLMGLAAAAVLVLAVRAVVRPPAPVDPGLAAPTGTVLSELEELSSNELESVLGDWDEEQVGTPAAGVPGLSDLSADELERVLRSWET